MTDDFDIPTRDMTDSGSTEFVLRNYPASGEDVAVEMVTFGPATPNFNLLLSMNPETEVLEIVVGNGPNHREAPTLLSETLHDVAQILNSLNDDPQYQAALEANGE